MKEKIAKLITDSIEAKKAMLQPENIKSIEDISVAIINAYKSCKKVVAFGNGGSAADAQHLVAELVARFEMERMALPAIAFTTNSSTITAIGNDYGFDYTYKRQVEALVGAGDVVIGLSTSGNSPNVISALEEARRLKAVTVGFTGNKECKMSGICDFVYRSPSTITPRIQECHITAIHVICSIVESTLFKK